MKKKNKIIITGSSGFIGSALTQKLSKDYNIIGIDRKSPSGVLMDIRSKGNFNYFLQDINDKLPDIKDVYAVIHLAAKAGVRDSHKKFEQVCKDNILATQRIIDMCITKWKPKRFLLASSSSVYGDLGKDGHALKVTDGVSPMSPYAMSKVAGEQLVTTYKNCGLLDGIETTSMRFFTVYGPNQRNDLAIRSFIDCILRDKPITLYGTGDQTRDFTHIDDICKGINELLKYGYGEIVNIGSGKTISINNIIHMIATYLDKNVTIDYQPRNIYDIDCTKASDSVFIENKIKFEDGLKEQIEWQKEKYKVVELGKSLQKSAKSLDKIMKAMK